LLIQIRCVIDRAAKGRMRPLQGVLARHGKLRSGDETKASTEISEN
jgi:hypothetical protein